MNPPVPRGPIHAYTDAQLAAEARRIRFVLDQITEEDLRRAATVTVDVPLPGRTNVSAFRRTIAPWPGIRGALVAIDRDERGVFVVTATFPAGPLFVGLGLRLRGIRDEHRRRRGEPPTNAEDAEMRVLLATATPEQQEWLARVRADNERKEHDYRERRTRSIARL